MIINKLSLTCLFIFIASSLAQAKLPKEEIYSLYNQANQQFREGNSAKDPEQAKRHYEKAILSFERIIKEGKVKNVKLYYNLANAYFLQGQLGKAILNYRRAEALDDADENVQKNLTFARSKRIDKIPTKTEKRILHTLFFWHYDFSLKTKFLLTCIFCGIVFLSVTVIVWFGRRPAWIGPLIIFSILTLCFLISVVMEYKTSVNKVFGVITTKEVVALQGDGLNYPPSFKEPLHEGTEFDLLEERPGWLHIRLSDGSNGWITEDSAELI
jgi:hypothetical protein